MYTHEFSYKPSSAGFAQTPQGLMMLSRANVIVQLSLFLAYSLQLLPDAFRVPSELALALTPLVITIKPHGMH